MSKLGSLLAYAAAAKAELPQGVEAIFTKRGFEIAAIAGVGVN